MKLEIYVTGKNKHGNRITLDLEGSLKEAGEMENIASAFCEDNPEDKRTGKKKEVKKNESDNKQGGS